MSTVVYMGFGANIGDPLSQILAGLETLRKSLGVFHLQSSSIYQTLPMGGPKQPDFLNGVARFQYKYSPLKLLNLFHEIEQQQGLDRAKKIDWGPRHLDFDILLFGDTVHCCKRLEIPHPRIIERPFVVIPLAEIAPHVILPNGLSAYATTQYMDLSMIQCLYTAEGLANDCHNHNT